MADAERAGALAQGDVGAPQGGHLADPQAGLQHELDQGVVAPGEAMGALASGAQQSMDLGRGEADGLAVAGQMDRPDPGGDVGGDNPGGLGPAQQAADGLETAVDGGCPELAAGDHVLAPGDDVVLGQPRQIG